MSVPPPVERLSREGDRLLTAGEVADLLNVPESWVRRESRADRMPHVRLGHYVRYRRQAVLAWIAQQEQNGSAG